MSENNITKKTVISSLLWKFLERGGVQGVQFVLSIVLARLVSPADYGIVSLLLVFVQIANVFIQSGFNTALIQKKNSDDVDFSSILYLSLFVSLVLYLVLFFAAPFFAGFYKQSSLCPKNLNNPFEKIFKFALMKHIQQIGKYFIKFC